jgi:hypothetical protein
MEERSERAREELSQGSSDSLGEQSHKQQTLATTLFLPHIGKRAGEFFNGGTQIE